MKLTQIILAIFLSLPMMASYGETSKPAVQTLKKQAGVWIDVRTPEEYQSGHLSGSINVPVDQIVSQIAKIEPNKSAPINLYCRSGRRAEVARTQLIKMGYSRVVNHGGYDDLYKKGYR